VYDISSEDEEDAAPVPLFSPGDYVHADQEEEFVIVHLVAVSEAEARA
jgi:hypothetical protein